MQAHVRVVRLESTKYRAAQSIYVQNFLHRLRELHHAIFRCFRTPFSKAKKIVRKLQCCLCRIRVVSQRWKAHVLCKTQDSKACIQRWRVDASMRNLSSRASWNGWQNLPEVSREKHALSPKRLVSPSDVPKREVHGLNTKPVAHLNLIPDNEVGI